MIKLPDVSKLLAQSSDSADFVRSLNDQIQQIENFIYADQISIKLEEMLQLMETKDDSSFLRNMRNKWSHDLQAEFIKAGIFFDSSMRRKSIISMLGKMNCIMYRGKSINSIHDLMGLEFNILTPTEYDTAETITTLYRAVNIILEYFAVWASKNSNLKKPEKFTLCDASDLKDVYSLEEMKKTEVRQALKEVHPNCFIPERSQILEKYQGFVKDYYLQPKKDSCYQGIQFVIKTSNNLYFEIQVKTQPVIEYRDNPNSPAFHDKYKEMQYNSNNNIKSKIPLFDLQIKDSEKIHICGFRNNILTDKSGIIAPLHWELRKHVTK